ncbi:MAG: tyrosine-type recombinase/integrase [Nibricoccus sp.]
MPLELQRGRSKWWYGRFEVNGRNLCKNLGVEVKGAIPPSLTDQGDLAFECSRAKAQAALEKLQLDAKKRSTAEELVQAIHEIRTGSRIGSIPLDEGAIRWKALPRRRPLSARYIKQAESWMSDFVTFVNANYPAVKEMADVQQSMGRSYFTKVEAKGVSGKTYNNTLIFLRSCFEALKDEAGIPKNPFLGLPTKDEDTVFRKPYSEEDLAAIVDAAKEDPFIYPIVITSLCTAMRRGDCCMLLNTAVDLPGRFVKVKTSKTGELVQIPIFPLLRDVLEKRKKDDSSFVFADQAKIYKVNPDNITYRFKKVMRAAGFFDLEEDASEEDKARNRGETQQVRPGGLRKASVRDFHSFRVTWVTLALTAGVPLEIVKKVTGHRTAAIVMKHYFQPGREEFRRTLTNKLPSILGGGGTKALNNQEIAVHLKAMSGKTWKQIRDDLLKLIAESEKIVAAIPVVPAA